MGSSFSNTPGDMKNPSMNPHNQPETIEISNYQDNDSTERALKMIERENLTPCKNFAQEVLECVRGNHGEATNCIPPIKLFEQCVQDITYEQIRKHDFNLHDVSSWKI